MADFRTTQKDTARRRFLSTARAVTGATGAVAVAVPFMRSWQPSARARAAGAPVEVALAAIAPGQQVLVTWRRKPVWVLRRTPDMLQRLRSGELESRLLDPDSQADQQPEYAENPVRSVRPDIFVVVAICTHLGCIPNFRPESARRRSIHDGPGVIFVRAMAPSSTLPGVYSRAYRRP